MFDEYKDVSFWSIVLFCVTAMIIHHIVSGSDIIEGLPGARKRKASQTRKGRAGGRRRR